MTEQSTVNAEIKDLLFGLKQFSKTKPLAEKIEKLEDGVEDIGDVIQQGPDLITKPGRIKRLTSLFNKVSSLSDEDAAHYMRTYYEPSPDKAHGPDHINKVRERMAELVAKTGYKDKGLADAAALLHDIGSMKDRKHHEIVGAEIASKDPLLAKRFNKRRLAVLVNAIRQHRSSTGKPRSAVAKMLSDADRLSSFTSPGSSLARAYGFTKLHNPDMTDEEHIINAAKHQVEKYGPGGYGIKATYFPESAEHLNKMNKQVIEGYKNRDVDALRKLIEAETMKKSAAEYDVEGKSVQGVGLRKLYHKLLKEYKLKGMAVNDPVRGTVDLTIKGPRHRRDELFRSLAETLKKKTGHDIAVTPRKGRSRMKKIVMSDADLDALNRKHNLAYRMSSYVDPDDVQLEPLDKFKEGIKERYLLKDKGDGIQGRVPGLAYSQLKGETVPYKFMLPEYVARSKEEADKMLNKTAFLQGYMSKEALNYEQLNRAFDKKVKPLQVKNMFIRLMHWLNEHMPRTFIKPIDNLRIFLGGHTIAPPRDLTAFQHAQLAKHPIIEKLFGPYINLDRFSSKQVANRYGKGWNKLSDRSKRVLHDLIGLHELSEVRPNGGKGVIDRFYKKFGHRGPDVIMKEHNLVTTLPKEFDDVRQIMINMRKKTGEAKALAGKIPGFDYGKSPMVRNMSTNNYRFGNILGDPSVKVTHRGRKAWRPKKNLA